MSTGGQDERLSVSGWSAGRISTMQRPLLTSRTEYQFPTGQLNERLEFFFSFFFVIFKHWFVIKRKFENDGINGISVNSAISTNKFAYDFHVTKNKQNCTPNIWNSSESIHKKTENVEEKRKKLIDSRPPAAPCSGRSSQLEPSAR